jgi:UDP-3-O-[3-hydroxymyristoyl] glucosamine N-acyltransferase
MANGCRANKGRASERCSAAAIAAGTILHAGVVVGAGSKIGRNCTLYPRVVLYPGVVIGNDVLLHAGVVVGGDGFGFVADGKQQVKFPQVGGVIIAISTPAVLEAWKHFFRRRWKPLK